MDDVGRLLLCHVASLASLAIALSVQKLHTGSFGQGWKMSYILSFVAQNLEVVLAMTGICTAMEAANSALAVCAHVLHTLFCLLGLPYTFCEVVNPIYYPPLFSNLLETKSLSDFWGTTWQQTLRRSFIVSGAFPLGGLARALGMTTKIQKHVGFLGVFVVSGLLHAYGTLQQEY
ncbi:hypothetical protein O181_002110 [Austropuccinia psidii MF-1]|uniref:Wax synthase domain-containing protein n=1 Tax=Austropuccinia psidii MF-1 TaxID=1389203 RepID=A0A9Q3BBT5_9BASI|nr:hypothetical protein [Austropuccinia psidii MF-1]